MKKSNNLTKDIVSGFFLLAGIFGFVSGEFVISTLLFAMASLSSNMHNESSLEA